MKKTQVDKINRALGNQVLLYPITRERVQISVPFYHADGDPMEIYLMESDMGDDHIKMTDAGMTLMRLSYSEPLSDALLDDVGKLVNQYRFTFVRSEITLDVPLHSIESYIHAMVLVISKVMGLSSIRAKRVQSSFDEDLHDFIMMNLAEYSPYNNFAPVREREEVLVDYKLTVPEYETMIFLFPVRGNDRVKDVWGRLMFFLQAEVQFKSLFVCQDMHELSKKNQKLLTTDGDKVMYSDDFMKQADSTLHRLVS